MLFLSSEGSLVSMQIPVGDEAEQVNDKLLDVIRPHLVKLRSARVIDHRDASNVCFMLSLIHRSSRCIHFRWRIYLLLSWCFAAQALLICYSCALLIAYFFQWSPHQLRMLKDKFDQAPPPNIPLADKKEIGISFQALTLLYGIMKMLLSYGIKAAHQSIEAKYKEGYCLHSTNTSITMFHLHVIIVHN